MSNITFGQLPNQVTITANTVIPTVSANTNYTVTVANLETYITANTYSNANAVSLLASFGSNTVSTTGNIAGGYVLGNGSQLTGLPATYTNSNVITLLSAFGANVVSTTGNITGGYFLGNGSQLTGLPATYSNANVANYLPIFSGNIAAGNVSVTGNVAGTYFIGNGSLLTGIASGNSTYGNANVVALLSAYGNNISSTGNITAANVTVSFTMSSQGNVVGARLITSGTVSAVGNISGGNASIVGNITSSYILANAALATGVVNLIDDQTAAGNKTFSGTTTLNTYIETTASSVNTGNSFTPVWTSGPVQQITANANFTLNAPTGMLSGSSITLVISQDATGNRAMTPNASYKFGYGIKTLSTAANAVDVMSIFYSGSSYLCNLVKGYS